MQSLDMNKEMFRFMNEQSMNCGFAIGRREQGHAIHTNASRSLFQEALSRLSSTPALDAIRDERGSMNRRTSSLLIR